MRGKGSCNDMIGIQPLCRTQSGRKEQSGLQYGLLRLFLRCCYSVEGFPLSLAAVLSYTATGCHYVICTGEHCRQTILVRYAGTGCSSMLAAEVLLLHFGCEDWLYQCTPVRTRSLVRKGSRSLQLVEIWLI